MMDAKTICNMLRNPALTLDRYNMAPMDRTVMREIADFIEQQEKYTEFGKCAEKWFEITKTCNRCSGLYMSETCIDIVRNIECTWQDYCEWDKKRAELQNVKVYHER